MSFLALSVDHPISKIYKEDKEFLKFKKECSKTGTTEELLQMEKKLDLKQILLAINPLDNEKSSCIFCKFCFNGLWSWCCFWVSCS